MFLSEKVWRNLKPAPQGPQSVTAYPTLMEDSRVQGSDLDQVYHYSVNQYGVSDFGVNPKPHLLNHFLKLNSKQLTR